MNHVKTILFLVLCLAVGVGIGKAYVWFMRPASAGFTKNSGPPVITGVGDAPAVRGFVVQWDRLPTEPLMKEWEKAHATAMGIAYDAGLSQPALTEAVALAHGHDMQVVMVPAGLGEGAGRERAPFPNESITAVASMAEQAKVDYLCVSDLGTEPNAEYWRNEIAMARGVYKGKIILAARMNVLFRIDFWDLADVIGVVGPVQIPQRLPDAPDEVQLHDMRVAWDCVLTSLDTFGKVNRKKVALLNMNVPAEVSAKLTPPWLKAKPLPNPALQDLIYEALLLETKGRAEMDELLLFNWGDERDAVTLRTPRKMPIVMEKMRDYWDPQKPKPVETAPTTEEIPADGYDTGDGDQDSATN
jgi:hypothetical protein